MKKNVQIAVEQLNKYLNEFYEYFKTGYEFEEFLKIYLERLGLDEVSVTQRSRDGGIDLKALRNGVGGFSDVDSVEYYVQAKRNKPGTSVSVKKVRELKGTIPFGNKGIFITTAKFSQDAINESSDDMTKPVVLIDGKALIESCIDNEIGFMFTPVFSKASMDELRKDDEQSEKPHGQIHGINSEEGIVVDRQITANDIRAKILVVPKIIMDAIPSDINKLKVFVNGNIDKDLKIDKSRRYLSGVTGIYRSVGLIDEDGSFNPKKATWKYAGGKTYISIKENIER